MIAAPLPLILAATQRDVDGRLVSQVFASNSSRETPPALLLVAIDESENALRAVDLAMREAKDAHDGCLHLVHVLPWLSKEAAEHELEARGLAATARARALVEAQGLDWQLHVKMGDPAERILETPADVQARAIVIGSRGLNVVEGLLLGSVTRKVVQSAGVPVTVVP
jgi:nucleotide-binding universal stress UspA family protein